jgi:hypothetical protein
MSGDNVRALPGVERILTSIECQPDLFLDAGAASNKFVFLDIEACDQERFLEIVALNSVSAVIDLRPSPVFKKPKYIHKEIVQYLSDRHIVYFEFAMTNINTEKFSIRRVADLVNRNREQGLTVCVFDSHSVERGWVDRVRHNFSRSAFFTAEMNPRVLRSS